MRRILMLLVGVAVLLSGLSVVAIVLNWQKDDEVRLYDHVETVRTGVVRVLADVESIESRQRGFLLTRQSKYLGPAESEKKQLALHIARLRDLTAQDPVQREDADELSHLVDLRLAEIADTLVAMRQSQELEEAVEHLQAGQQTMDAIRQAAANMSSDAKQLLSERRQSLIERANILWTVLAVQTTAGLALLGLAVLSFRDYVREEKARTDELVAARNRIEEALAIKTRFLATVSHEVRTPMAGVIGLTELLSLHDFGADVNSTVRAILDSAKRLLRILNDLLDASRLESGKIRIELRHFPARSLIGDVVQLVKPAVKQKHLQVSGSCDEHIPESLCGDELRVRQILTNLAFNAVKFTEKGEIQIRSELKEHNEEQMVVRFSVSDTGIGISEQMQKAIFEPFVQEHDSTSRVFGGTGLGLSISRQLVELMGGQIGVVSAPGKGSTFWFEIPFAEGRCLL